MANRRRRNRKKWSGGEVKGSKEKYDDEKQWENEKKKNR